MEPLGDIEAGYESYADTDSASNLYSDWSYDPDATQGELGTLGVFMDPEFGRSDADEASSDDDSVLTLLAGLASPTFAHSGGIWPYQCRSCGLLCLST